MMKKIVLYIFCLVFTAEADAQISIKNLRCEMLNNPLGIDVQQPRFSWQLKSSQRNVIQTSYQLIVSSSEQKLKANDGDIWNSGIINESKSILITYAGHALQSAKKYYWKVKVITNKGEAGSNENAFFSTGLLNAADWKAKWIGYDKASAWDSITTWSRLSARYLRK
jgi:alpha-L-rhamnosidase